MLLEARPTGPSPAGRAGEHPCSPAEQALLAVTLVTTWSLITGRVLRSEVSVDQLSAEELINFWADPLFDEKATSA